MVSALVMNNWCLPRWGAPFIVGREQGPPTDANGGIDGGGAMVSAAANQYRPQPAAVVSVAREGRVLSGDCLQKPATASSEASDSFSRSQSQGEHVPPYESPTALN